MKCGEITLGVPQKKLTLEMYLNLIQELENEDIEIETFKKTGKIIKKLKVFLFFYFLKSLTFDFHYNLDFFRNELVER